MRIARRKSLFYALIYTGILSIFLIPLYMYFSHDVERLKDEFPHPVFKNADITFELKKSAPKNWVRLREISKYARWAIVLSEDWSFYQHQGIDVEQIKVAVNEMFEERRFRGASTITQQMVKNVYLSEERSIWRKFHEIILAQKVERVLTKERILEIYLNCIEFGPGIYGIRQASSHYFRKSPSTITPKEAAFLAMLLPSPKRYYISFKRKKLTRFASARINAILVKMRMGKVLTPVQFEEQRVSRLSWEK